MAAAQEAVVTVVVNQTSGWHLQVSEQERKYLRKAEKLHTAADAVVAVAAAVDVN